MDIYSQLPEPKSFHYLNRYITLMKWASQQKFEGYTEKHHIIPDSFYIKNRKYKKEIKKNLEYKSTGWLEGNPNSKENYIKISARIHFLAHYMLWRAYRTSEMAAAFMFMKGNVQNNERYWKINSKAYEKLKITMAEACSKRMTGQPPSRGSWKKDNIPWNKGLKGVQIRTEDMNIRASNTLKERYKTQEHNRKGISPWCAGTKGMGIVKAWNKGTIANKLECPHCHFVGGPEGNMYRWHFDNCKKLKNEPNKIIKNRKGKNCTDGIHNFNSLIEASKFYKAEPSTILYWIKHSKNNFSYGHITN